MLRRPHKRHSRYTPIAESILRSTGRLTDKSFNALAKQNHDAAARTTRMISTTELMQSINFREACSAYSMRRMQRSVTRLERSMQTGKEPSITEQVLWWGIDAVRFLWDILWGFLEPIIMMFLYGLASVVLTFVFAAILIYAIYLFLTA